MIKAILYIGIAQCFFVATLVITKKKKLPPDHMLLWWLSTIMFKFILYLLNQEHKEFFNISFSAGFVPLTFGPFLYLYTKFLTNEDNTFKIKHLLHFLPFVLLTLTYFIFFSDRVTFDEDSFLKQDDVLWVRILYALCYFTSILVYTLLTFLSLRRYRKEIRNILSVDTAKTRLYWLNYLAILFALTFFIYFIFGFINAVSFKKIYDGNLVSSIGLTLLAFSVSFFGLRQPAIFKYFSNDTIPDSNNYSSNIVEAIIDNVGKGTASQSDVVSTSPIEEQNITLSEKEEEPSNLSVIEYEDDLQNRSEKYKKNLLKPEEMLRISDLVLKYMEEEKPYLNPELTILDLSAKLNVSKHHLTQVLNSKLGKNFFTFVNEYRIAAVKSKIQDEKYAHLTLLALAFECGFNSKSAFNNIFKQYTGNTPSEYKKNIEENRK